MTRYANSFRSPVWRALISLAPAACSAGAFAQSPSTSAGQGFPARPVHIVASTPPGGPVDFVARMTAQKLGEVYGRQFVVENRAGAGGAIGAEYVAKSAPDGYTLLVASPATLCIAPAIRSRLPYDPLKDFAPVGIVTIAAFMLASHPSLPVKSVKELISLARARPGQLDYASTGSGTFTHLSMELLKSMTKIQMVHVPYNGAAPAITDLLSGRMQLLVNGVTVLHPHLKAGKLRGLAVTSHQRSALVSDMPTMAEAGVPGYEATNWFGLAARGGTPRDVVVSLNAALAKGLNSPEMKEKMLSQGLELVLTTPDNFAQIIRDEIVKWAKVVKDSGAIIE